jgi:hypothetical protein
MGIAIKIFSASLNTFIFVLPIDKILRNSVDILLASRIAPVYE